MIGRPQDFRDAARSLRSASASVNDDGRRLRAMAESVLERWESPAARAFEANEVPASLRSYGFVVRDLDSLALALERAASDLELKVREVKRIEHEVRGWFASQPPNDDGSPPRWETQHWRYRPGHFPGTADSAWYEVRRYLRSIGFTF